MNPRLLGIALPAAAALAMAAPGTAAAGREFAPPAGRMIVTRTVWRPLKDGAQIMVRRSYEISFRATGEGYRADGHLVAVEVDTPPRLEPIARIERDNRVDDPFPITLDRAGRIVAVSTSASQAPVRAASAAASIGVLKQEGLDPAQLRKAEAFVTTLAKTGTGNQWPLDLFNPDHDRTDEHRQLALPDGREGEVEVVTEVEDRFPGGVPRRFDRTVTTTLAGAVSTSRERWTVNPAAGPK